MFRRTSTPCCEGGEGAICRACPTGRRKGSAKDLKQTVHSALERQQRSKHKCRGMLKKKGGGKVRVVSQAGYAGPMGPRKSLGF
jgi:hypothetical protein